MQRRTLFLLITVVAVVILLGGFGFAANFANHVNPPHTAPGAATACGTPVPSTGLRTFHILSDQSTASYTVHENLVLRNLPNNNAVGKTQSVQGEFRIRSSASPLVADMNIKVDLRTLKSE